MPIRPTICRFGVRDGPAAIGKRLVVKRLPNAPTDDAYATRYPSLPYRFFNDWAGLQFLTQAAPDPPLSPRLLAADHATRLIVMEDLAPAHDISTVLKGHDPQRASEALLQWGQLLGTLHAHTIGKAAIYQRIRDDLAPREASWGWVPHWQRTTPVYARLIQTLPDEIKAAGFASFHWMRFVLRQAADALTVSAEAAADLERAIQALREPGPFLAYAHGDPCPGGNCLLTTSRLKLIDFENGDYRHALLDAVYPRMAFPTCWDARRLPNDLIARIERAYQAELARGCPEAADSQRFQREMAHACAYWALLACRFDAIARFATGDRYWRPYHMRQKIIARCERFAQTTAEFGYLEALGAVFARIARTLRERFPQYDQPLPLYPAFARSTGPS